MLEKELYHAEVDFKSSRVHAHGDATEVHEKGPLHADLVDVGAVLEEDLGDAEADAFVLERAALVALC